MCKDPSHQLSKVKWHNSIVISEILLVFSSLVSPTKISQVLIVDYSHTYHIILENLKNDWMWEQTFFLEVVTQMHKSWRSFWIYQNGEGVKGFSSNLCHGWCECTTGVLTHWFKPINIFLKFWRQNQFWLIYGTSILYQQSAVSCL